MSYDPYTNPQADPAASTQWGQQSSGYDGRWTPVPDAQPYYPAQPAHIPGLVERPYDLPGHGYVPQPQPVYAPTSQPQPVVVNVTQNNSVPMFVRPRRVNHKLHGWLTFWTGGMWAPVWIYVANRKPKVYR